MYQWSFRDVSLLDDPGSYTGSEPGNEALLFDNAWFSEDWADFSRVEDGDSEFDDSTLTSDSQSEAQDVSWVGRGQETAHELLSRQQEEAIAAQISVAFAELQAAIGRDRARLDGMLEHIHGELCAEQPAQCDKVITLFDTLQVYEALVLRSPRFEEEYFQVWQRLCDALKSVAMNRDYVLELAENVLSANASGAATSASWIEDISTCKRAVYHGRNRFVSANIRLVYHVARRHMDRGMALEDMVQEGVLGLMRAALKFDAAVGVRFSTYAFWWIKQAIRQAIARQRSLIRYPTHINDQVNRVYGVIQDELRRTGQKPDLKRLQKATGFSRAQVKDLMALTNLCVSGDTPLYDDGDKTLLDGVSYAQSFASPEEDSVQREVQQSMARFMAVLSPRETMILQMKYGIGQRRPYSLNEIAPQMGVSRERVRQIIEEGIAKIRAAFPDETMF